MYLGFYLAQLHNFPSPYNYRNQIPGLILPDTGVRQEPFLFAFDLRPYLLLILYYLPVMQIYSLKNIYSLMSSCDIFSDFLIKISELY